MSISTVKVVKPHDVSLVSTNVVDYDGATEWLPTETYYKNKYVRVTTSTPYKVYKSLRSNNTNKPPADNLEPVEIVGASTTSIDVATGIHTFTTDTGLGFIAGMAVVVEKTTTPNTVSMKADVVSYNSTSGELIVSAYSKNGEGTHSDWTITSADEVAFWEEIEATNQYKMLDGYLNTQTTNDNSIEATLKVYRTDCIALMGLVGETVELELWDSTDTNLLWNDEVNLIYSSSLVQNISDWWEYFFGAQLIRTILTANTGVTVYEGLLKIKITATNSEKARCGHIVAGRVFEIGHARYGLSAGIVDYSDIDEDEDTGNTSVTAGPWAKTNEISMYIYNENFDNVYRLITSLRSTPTVWAVGDDWYESFTVFGLCRDFDITYSTNVISYCNLEIKGLI